MKKIIRTIGISALCLSVLASCDAVQNANQKQKGAVIGAGAGAIIGGIIGNNSGDKGSGNSEIGMAIGTLIGGLAGGIIGDKMDRQAEKIEAEIPGAQVERVDEHIEVTFDEKSGGLYFDFDSSSINTSSRETLDKFIVIMNEIPDTNISIQGHTDSKGSDTYNQTLSEKRANAVYDYLRSNYIDSSRLSVSAYGESMPKYTNDTEEGRAKNRRVEIKITANEKMMREAQQQVKN